MLYLTTMADFLIEITTTAHISRGGTLKPKGGI